MSVLPALRTRRPVGSEADRGAVAVIVAILAVLLFAMAAFAVDFGNAYATKRQLSVAVDAAALAAGQAVNSALPRGTACNAAALKPIAKAAAEKNISQSDRSGDSKITQVDVTCTTHGVEVAVYDSRSVTTVFAGILGVKKLTPTTMATSVVQVPPTYGGLRPIAACQTTVLNATQSQPYTTFVAWISKDKATCGTAFSGQWGFANFLNQGAYGNWDQSGSAAYFPGEDCSGGSWQSGGNAGCQSEWVGQGYGGPVTVPNLATSGTTGIAGNTGLDKSGTYRAGLNSLVGQVIQLPVADKYVSNRLNTLGVISALVCAVNQGGTIVGPGAGCTSSNPEPTDPDYATWTGTNADKKLNLNNNEGGLLLLPVAYSTSGVFGGTVTCQVGDTNCDYGLNRVVVLYR